MKQILAIFCLLLIVSCDDKKENVTFLPSSSGEVNNISVVSDNALWENEVGGTIRTMLAAPVKGLPQEEPMFSINQIPTPAFKGKVNRNRAILQIKKTDASGIEIKNNVYSKPQILITVSGDSDQEIIDVLQANSAKIIDAFTKSEISEKLRIINKSLLNDNELETALGITVDIPSIYRFAKKTDDFFWLRKGLKSNKTMDLVFYSYPLDAIRKGDSAVVDIVKMRNKTMAREIPGEDGIVMTTEDTFTPSLYKSIIDNKQAYETRGMWKVKGAYMAGPFVNYAIEDKVNNRYLVAEGYVYAPSLDKREYIFELESIIKSIEIK